VVSTIFKKILAWAGQDPYRGVGGFSQQPFSSPQARPPWGFEKCPGQPKQTVHCFPFEELNLNAAPRPVKNLPNSAPFYQQKQLQPTKKHNERRFHFLFQTFQTRRFSPAKQKETKQHSPRHRKQTENCSPAQQKQTERRFPLQQKQTKTNKKIYAVSISSN